MLLFMFMYMLSFYLVLGFDSWLLVWVGLEINMISFILLVFRHHDSVNMESCLKYFFIQASGSAMLIFLWVYNFLNVDLVLLVLSFKLGAGPFFFWMPGIVKGVGWMMIFVLLGFQKVMPLFLMSMMVSDVVWLMALVSLVVGCFGMFNQLGLKELMLYSSIHHLGWMMLLMYLVGDYWMMYLVLYMIMVYPLMYYFMGFEVKYINELVEVKDKFMLCVGILSLAGIPPMLGFFLKMWAFKMLMDVSMFFFVFMIFMSVVMAYVYVKLIYSIIMWEVNVNLMVGMVEMKMMSLMMWMYIIGMMLGLVLMWI